MVTSVDGFAISGLPTQPVPLIYITDLFLSGIWEVYDLCVDTFPWQWLRWLHRTDCHLAVLPDVCSWLVRMICRDTFFTTGSPKSLCKLLQSNSEMNQVLSTFWYIELDCFKVWEVFYTSVQWICPVGFEPSCNMVQQNNSCSGGIFAKAVPLSYDMIET